MFTSVLALGGFWVYIPPNATTIATFDVLNTYLEPYVSDPQSLHALCGDFNVIYFGDLFSIQRKQIILFTGTDPNI